MSSPQVGDVLVTVDELDGCPMGAIVRSEHGVVVQKGFGGGWFRPGHAEPFGALELFRIFDDRWEVLWVPPVIRVEVTTDTWTIEPTRVSFLHTPELLDLLRSVPVGSRVRVTVEKIGDDDE